MLQTTLLIRVLGYGLDPSSKMVSPNCLADTSTEIWTFLRAVKASPVPQTEHDLTALSLRAVKASLTENLIHNPEPKSAVVSATQFWAYHLARSGSHIHFWKLSLLSTIQGKLAAPLSDVHRQTQPRQGSFTINEQLNLYL